MMRAIPEAEITLDSLSSHVGGQVCGDGSLVIRGLAGSDDSSQDRIGFVKEVDPRRLERALPGVKVGAVFAHRAAAEFSDVSRAQLILVDDPLQSFVATVPLFYTPAASPSGIHPTAVVDATAIVDPSATVGPLCYVGPQCRVESGAVLYSHVVLYHSCVVGKGSMLHSHVTLREGVTLGEHCSVQSGAVLGSDGFGYFFDPKRGLVAVPQLGGVVLGNGVDVGANSCIDRGTLGMTAVATNSKIDNLVQIGHNVTIGSNSILCGQVGVAGSSSVGSGVTLGGQVGVTDHVSIADGIRVGGKSAVLTNLETKGDYAGIPAVPAREWRRGLALLKQLPERLKRASKSDA